MNELTFDIAVIGAGPAGSTAARHAAAAGAKVCLLERNPVPGEPVRCGEGIGMQSLSNFSDARPEWIKARVTQSIMISPDGTRVTISDIDNSVVLDRAKMDGDLAKAAVTAGAELFVNTPVTSILRGHDGLYRCSTPTTTFIAKICIIADGVESRVARDLGWKTTLAKNDIQSCAFTRVFSPLIEKETCVFHIGSNVAPGGYAWVFSRGSGEANVGLGILGGRATPGAPQDALKKFLDKEFPGARTGPIHCGGVPVTGYMRPLVRDGALLVGDAARQVNCLSGAGIGYSLFAGKIAGKTAAEALQNNTTNLGHLLNYEKIWKKQFGKQQLRSLTLKDFVVEHATDKFLDRVAHSLAKKKPGKTRYLTVFLSTFSRHPLLMFKAFKLFK